MKMSWRFGRRKHNTFTLMLVAKLEPTRRPHYNFLSVTVEVLQYSV